MKANPFIIIEPGILSYGPAIEIPSSFDQTKEYTFGPLAPGTEVVAYGWVAENGERIGGSLRSILPSGGTLTVKAGWTH